MLTPRRLRAPLTALLALALLGACADVDDRTTADDASGGAIDDRGGATPPGGATATTCEGVTGDRGAGCAVTPGGPALLLQGHLLLPDRILEDGTVLVVDGSIACVGCDCESQPEAAGATRLSCLGEVISPGLINAHDHITFTEMAPVPHGDERFDHRHEWRRGQDGHTRLPTRGNSHRLGDAWGEMRQVIGGATSLFGSGGEEGFLRNLDRGRLLEGIEHEPALYSTFPLGDSDGDRANSGCDIYRFDEADDVLGAPAYVPHVAEGIGVDANNEFQCLAGQQAGASDFLLDTAAFIHGIGLTAPDIALLAGAGTGLIWSPRSNTDLYGITADVPVYHRLGARIALGTDWTASGSVTVLRELACARHWNELYWDGHFDDATLVGMVTHQAAEVLGFGDVLGSLVTGKAADITVWRAGARAGHRAVLEADTADALLVLRGGVALYGDDATVAALTGAGECEALDVCGEPRRLCSTREIGITVGALEAELPPEAYGLFFCGDPPGEPSCDPFRPGEFDGVRVAGDQDGDGVADGDDLCPRHFDAPRPLDGPSQRDADADGVGDLCDPCPLDANTEACTSANPDDIDGDAVLSAVDNCPRVANPDQLDGDTDGLGDACDPCPAVPNPGGAGCPASIYDIRTGQIASGEAVTLPAVRVTAVAPNGFFVTEDPTAEDYAGPEHSGIFAFAGDDPVDLPIGAVVAVRGTVNDFFGEIQITAPQVEVLDAAAPPLDAVAVAPADVAPGGRLEAAYSGLLVEVTDVEVLDTAPTGAEGETVEGEFLVTGNLSVDDGIFALDPPVQVGQRLPVIRGVLRWSWGRNKLLPRSAEDFDLGAPTLLAFGPPEAWIYMGAPGLSAPPLELSLTAAPEAALFVAVTADPSDLATIDGGGVSVPPGAMSAAVALTPSRAGGPAVVRAALGDVTLEAALTVLPADHVPAVAAVTADTAEIPQRGLARLTITLAEPAPPAGVDVSLSLTGVAATAPAVVAIGGGEREATVDLFASTEAGALDVRAETSSGGADLALTVREAADVDLVLVEVLYNPDGGDNGREWVRLYNGTADAIDLSGYSLGWGGDSWSYGTHDLAGEIEPGACLVVGGPVTDIDNGEPQIDHAGDFDPDMQNGGSAADGVALFDVPAADIGPQTVPIDAVLYDGENVNELIGPDGAPFAAAHVPDVPRGASLVRDGATTWTFREPPNAAGCIIP